VKWLVGSFVRLLWNGRENKRGSISGLQKNRFKALVESKKNDICMRRRKSAKQMMKQNRKKEREKNKLALICLSSPPVAKYFPSGPEHIIRIYRPPDSPAVSSCEDAVLWHLSKEGENHSKAESRTDQVFSPVSVSYI